MENGGGRCLPTLLLEEVAIASINETRFSESYEYQSRSPVFPLPVEP